MSKRQKTILFNCIIIVCLMIGCAKTHGVTNTNDVWIEDFQTALRLANEHQKYILINFTGSDWCVWCHRLEDEVFSQDEFLDFAAKNLILFKADFPQNITQTDELKNQNRTLLQRYEVRGFPTIIVIDENEKIVAESGYLEGGAVNWIANLISQLNEE